MFVGDGKSPISMIIGINFEWLRTNRSFRGLPSWSLRLKKVNIGNVIFSPEEYK